MGTKQRDLALVEGAVVQLEVGEPHQADLITQSSPSQKLKIERKRSRGHQVPTKSMRQSTACLTVTVTKPNKKLIHTSSKG